tara:strand:- start:5 stop:193 length:189 start_codon:yes stop_codon:yes gene_type:complete
MKVNWINSWNAGNKKEKYELNFRLGTVTVLEISFCPCPVCDNKKKNACPRFRFMILNFGFEV